MFNTIVWATDGSEAADNALPYVKSLAADSRTSVVVVHAVESFISGYSSEGVPTYGDTEDVKAKIAQQIEELRAEGISAGLTLLHVGTMRPAELIADAARRAHAEVVVTATRGHTPLGGLLVGSVTQRLLHIAPCAVLVVPVGERDGEREEAGAETTTA